MRLINQPRAGAARHLLRRDRRCAAGRRGDLQRADPHAGLCRPATLVRCGIGSGITADATAAGEWDDGATSAHSSTARARPSSCWRRLRLEEGVFVDVEAHLARMAEAAAHFAFALAAGGGTHVAGRSGRRARERLLARAPARGPRGRRARAGFRAGPHARPRARAVGRSPAGGQRRRVRALQDHAARALRRVRADATARSSTRCCGTSAAS